MMQVLKDREIPDASGAAGIQILNLISHFKYLSLVCRHQKWSRLLLGSSKEGNNGNVYIPFSLKSWSKGDASYRFTVIDINRYGNFLMSISVMGISATNCCTTKAQKLSHKYLLLWTLTDKDVICYGH
jgi:hypothetical protein